MWKIKQNCSPRTCSNSKDGLERSRRPPGCAPQAVGRRVGALHSAYRSKIQSPRHTGSAAACSRPTRSHDPPTSTLFVHREPAHRPPLHFFFHAAQIPKQTHRELGRAETALTRPRLWVSPGAVRAASTLSHFGPLADQRPRAVEILQTSATSLQVSAYNRVVRAVK